MWRRLAVGLVLITGLWAGAPATGAADAELTTGGMDLHLFRPAVDSRGHLSVNGSDVLPHKEYSFGLILDGGFRILPFRGFVTDSNRPVVPPDDLEDRTTHIVRQSYTGTFMFNFGLVDRLVVGLTIPIVILRGAAVQVPTATGSCVAGAMGCLYNPSPMIGDPGGLSHQSIGDIGLHAKVRLLNAGKRGVGIAGVLRMQFPTGSADEFGGEPGVAIWPSVVFEFRPIEKIRLSLEGGYRWNSGTGADFIYDGRTIVGAGQTAALEPALDPADPGTSFTYNDLITFGFGASFRVARPLDIVLEFYGTQIAQEIGTEGTLSMEAMGGLKYFVNNKSYLVLAAGAGIPKIGFQAAAIRGVLGFVYEPPVGDRDGDGIPDDDDACPDDPEDKDGFEDSDGCPDPDNDGDGILDVDDKCPLVPEDYDGERDEDGCPEGREGDRDGDGIPDDIDKCPDEPEDFDGFEDEDGCPDLDNDQDGIPDASDLCPNDPEDKDGFEDEDGCPDLDNDGDRIQDKDDACPDKPETYNGFEDDDGCPDRGRVIVEESRITILDKIYFATDSAVILEKSYPLIDAVAATLNGNPQITLVEVQGHADERGSDKYNIRLTRARAASVVDALISRGVAPDRLRSAGYGERCPVDPKSNPTAWERNRRVEFKILQTEDGPTGVEVTCPRGRALTPK